MKTRIVALILTVVMSLLALTSCGSFNFAKEDLTSYATFDYEAFKAALAKIEIEDGDFTTDEATREKLVQSKIYTTIADKIVAATYEADRKTEGTLGKGDVLYFVYYAVDADGNIYFTSEMKEASITASSTKANHVIKLGDVNEKADLQLKLKEALEEVTELKNYIYDMSVAADLTAEELAVKEGNTIVISYSRKHTDAEGTVVTESAAYETIVLAADSTNPLVAKFLETGAEAKIGSNLKAVTEKKEDGTVTTAEKFDIEIDGTKYTYENVKIQWRVESEGKAIATFKYTPYTTEKKVTPDNLYNTKGDKIDLKDKELTYYVYPVYAITAPAFEEITAADILVNVYASALKETSFEAFEDENYKNGDKKLADLLKDVANIYDTKTETNEVYKEGTELKTLLDAYNKAVKDGGDKPKDDQKKAIDAAKEALTKAQRAALVEVVNKIVACVSGDKNLGTEVFEEYEHNVHHSLKESYDSDITKKVQSAVWKLITDSVKVNAYPEKLVKDYVKQLYEVYEYNYYKGNYDSSTKNINKYAKFEDYLKATLKITDLSELDAALEKEAKAEIELLIKIYVVAKACEADAKAALPGYIEADIEGGAYNVSEKAFKDAYGDKADEKIEEAKKNAEESIESAREDADLFIIDDAYMKAYKKEVGRAYYRSIVEQYGEINIRAGFQFNRLFYYLTSTNIQLNEDGDHTEVKYTADGKLDFRTVTYTIKAETEADK